MAENKDLDYRAIALQVQDILQQNGQLGTQSSTQQVADAVQQAIQKVQGSSQEKVSSVERNTSSENKQEEINSGEALRSAVVSAVNSSNRQWNWNDKALIAKEFEFDLMLKALQIKDKEIEIARKEHNFAHQQKMDAQNLSIKQFLDANSLAAATNSQNFDHAVKFEYAKINNLASEPYSPDTGADEKDAAK